MRSNKILFTVVWAVGILLGAAVFLAIVPPEGRTDTKWLNFGILCLLWTGLFARFTLLYGGARSVANRAPLIAAYWLGFGWYAAAAVLAMPILWLCEAKFGNQLLVHACLLFAFGVFVAIGAGASNFITAESGRMRQEIGGVREIQSAMARLRVLLASLPGEYAFARTEFERVADEANCLSGSNDPKARDAESRILRQITELEDLAAAKGAPDACMEAVGALSASVAMRKLCTNV